MCSLFSTNVIYRLLNGDIYEVLVTNIFQKFNQK